jgi:outer membrane protein W
MRKFVLVLLTLLAVSASAQTLDKPTRVSLFVSNFALGFSESNGSFLDGGVGVALERRFSRRWSAELAVATEKHETQPYLFNPASFELRTYPIDAVVRYSFLDVQTRWRPYVGAGARYVAPPDEPPGVQYDPQFSPEFVAGVEFNGGESWSLHAGARQLIRDQTPTFDDWFKLSVGVGWRF